MPNLSAEQQNLASRYLALDEEHLYSLIAPHLPEYDSVRFSPDGQEEAGRRFFKKIEGRLRQAICREFDWPSKKNDPELQDRVNLVATVADVIASLTFGVPPFVIASILVKLGLNRFCATGEGDSPVPAE